ncbi:reverse transcriptase domain-containing protein [Trichonephila clavipes]|nr:reverse transcriptase domain-containing protein [Trichonephila clavipes]
MKIVVEDKLISDNLTKLWELENLGIEANATENISDDVTLKEFESGISFSDNRYSVRLPWKPGMKEQLQDNRTVALKRFRGLQSKFLNDPFLFNEYRAVLEEHKSENIIESVTNELKEDKTIFYLPHTHTGGWHRAQGDLYHGGSLQPPHDRRANRYINERLSLKSHLPGSVPLEYLDFCVRGKFCHLAQGNRGLIVVKGSDQRKIFEKLGLFTINLEILPHFRDLNDHSLPDHLHDDVHENFDISECTMVKSYRFARYLQYFNKLQAECKKQTAHLVE